MTVENTRTYIVDGVRTVIRSRDKCPNRSMEQLKETEAEMGLSSLSAVEASTSFGIVITDAKWNFLELDSLDDDPC